MAQIGMLILMGIVVKNGIVLIDHVNNCAGAGWIAPRRCWSAGATGCGRS